MGIKLYNKLPIQIKQLDTYKSFKKRLKHSWFIMRFAQLRNFMHSK